MQYRRSVCALFWLALPGTVLCADWRQFRGPTGQGTSQETGLPVQWSAANNIACKVKLPGAGASSPVILGKRIYLTCYSGYGMDTKEPGKQEDLRRHLLCLDRANGKVIWSKVFDPILPEHKYAGEGAYQGYAASTPITDGEKLYVFLGKSGVFCFDLDGEQLWQYGNNSSSAPSPLRLGVPPKVFLDFGDMGTGVFPRSLQVGQGQRRIAREDPIIRVAEPSPFVQDPNRNARAANARPASAGAAVASAPFTGLAAQR